MQKVRSGVRIRHVAHRGVSQRRADSAQQQTEDQEVKGMYFVEMQQGSERAIPVAQGRVGPQINQDYVFVQYDLPRKFSRTVNMAVITNFALFKTVEEMQAFLSPPKVADVPAGTPDEIVLDHEGESSAD